MKNIILSLGLLTSFCAFSQAVPSFIENYSYRYEALTTDEGEQFGTYKVIAKDNKTTLANSPMNEIVSKIVFFSSLESKMAIIIRKSRQNATGKLK